MTDPLVLAIDQGTTNTKSLLIDRRGTVVASAARAMTVDHPHQGWAEQSATAIWQAVAEVIADLTPGREIAAVAISNQRETVILWDARTGTPLAPAISWQCQRTAERCAALRAAGYSDLVARASGLGIDPMFGATKIAWLLDAVPDARRRAEAGELRAGTVDSWLLWKITGGAVHATDHSNASRTQLLDLHKGAWSDDLCRIFEIPRSVLPDVRSSNSLFGHSAPHVTSLPAGIPIHAIMGDSHAAMFAQAQRGADAKVTIGTGSSVMALRQDAPQRLDGLSGTIAWSRHGHIHYADEGNIIASGQAAAFAVRLLGVADEEALTALAQSVPDSGSVVFVPALSGLGAPHWDPQARGLICNMTSETRPAQVARATLEAIAHQIADVVDAAREGPGREISELAVDGGASRNALLLQMLADLTGCTILPSSAREASALGVATMAWQALGADDIAPDVSMPPVRPRIDAAGRAPVRREWRNAVAASRGLH
jgi:glycerol kinase